MTVQLALATLDTLPPSPARDAWQAALRSLPTAPRGTFAEWCKAHDGATVSTWQWHEVDGVDTMRNPWAPGPRTLSAGATFATFDDSRRDYRGSRVVAADDRAVVISSPAGDGRTIFCAYVVDDDVDRAGPWVDVVFVDNYRELDDAPELDDVDAVAAYLSQWDYGTETDDAHTSPDPLGAGTRDDVHPVTVGGLFYVLTVNRGLGYAGLSRRPLAR